MKIATAHLLILVAIIGFFSLQPALAQGKDKGKSSTVSESSYSSSNLKIGVGFASFDALNAPVTPTAWIQLDSDTAIQAFFTIAQTSPSFDFALGALYKHTLFENHGAGFHLGGGASIGSVTDRLALAFTGIGGIHYALPGAPQVILQFDGGPVFNLINGNSNFGIGALGSLLGASIVYVF